MLIFFLVGLWRSFFFVRTNDNINREEKIKEGNKRGIKLISTGYLLKHITSKMHGTLLL